MTKPFRNAAPHPDVHRQRTFFVTTKTSMGSALLQSDRNALLLIDVLRSCVAAGRFRLHDFVVMPDHLHLLLTVGPEMTIEKAIQFVKGGYSFRIKREYGYPGDVWQRGFSDVRIEDIESYQAHRNYIAQNPVKAGLVDPAEPYPWCMESMKRRKASGAKAPLI